MGKKLRFWAGAALGAGLQYLYDPKAGPSRRALLRDQITDWALDTRDGVVGKKLALGPFRSPAALAYVPRSSRAFSAFE
jgi:hypothetical protein